MKTVFNYFLLVIILCAQHVQGALDENIVVNFVKKITSSQTRDPYLWNAAGSGGYLFRFSADINGDGQEEQFLGSTTNFNKTRGDWDVHFNGVMVGSINLSGISFIAIRDRDAVRIPYVSYMTGTEAVVVEQTIENGTVKVMERRIHPDQLEQLQTEWTKVGRVIKPKIETILLADFVAGGRVWKEIDLTRDNYCFYNEDYFVLKSDELRLSKINLTPENALRALAASGSSDSPAEQSNSTKVWLWLGCAVSVLAAFTVLWFLLKRRQKRGQTGQS